VAPTLVAGQLQRSWQWWGAADAPAFRAGDRSSGSSPNGLPSRGDETDSSTTPPHPEPALEQPAQTQTETQASHHGLFDPIEVAAHSSTATHSMEPVVLSMGPSESVLRGGEPPAADLLRKAPIVGGCWGAHLSGRPCLQDWDLRQQFSSSGIFVRFCASCQHHGVLVPWERLRMLPEGSRLANSASNGAWTHIEKTLPPYRVCNQTRRCKGRRLVIFKYAPDEGTPSAAACAPSPAASCEPEMGWSLNTLLAEMLSAAGVTGGEVFRMEPLPAEYLSSMVERESQCVRLKLRNGTLVPSVQLDESLPARASPVATPTAVFPTADAESNKRPRLEGDAFASASLSPAPSPPPPPAWLPPEMMLPRESRSKGLHGLFQMASALPLCLLLASTSVQQYGYAILRLAAAEPAVTACATAGFGVSVVSAATVKPFTGALAEENGESFGTSVLCNAPCG